ncbi:MAG: NAD kinase [Candidatus Nanopelagicales bacterium]|nr:NAD kinase [Candidatus Nanopelagicales bacterium]
MSETRRALLVLNTRAPQAREAAVGVIADLQAAHFRMQIAADDALDWGSGIPNDVDVVAADETAANGCEVVVVLGGDGTILRAAERARAASVPILSVNLGHVGFLAEAESEDVHAVTHAIVNRRWHVEERMALDIRVLEGEREVLRTWALNEVSLEKATGSRMIDVLVAVDGRPLSRWGCDGVVASTPTGSTAYAFSAGGPVMWPEVEAMLIVPLSAHALFARPLVVGPSSVIVFEISHESACLLAADSRRTSEISGGSRIEVRRNSNPVQLARLADAPFTDRLVAKFALPVDGWRA